MSMFKKKSLSVDGIQYTQVEEIIVYTLKNKSEHKKVVRKLNKQLGFDWYRVKSVIYPYTLTIDLLEQIERAEKKNKYHSINQEEYSIAYIEETKKQLTELCKWIEKHPSATLDYCKKKFNSDITNVESDKSGRNYWFDMYYGNMCVTLERNGVKDKLHIMGDIELYDDDFTGGSGEFNYDTELVENDMKNHFNIGFYSVA